MCKQKCRLWFLSVVKTNLLQNQIKSRWIAYSLWHAHTRLTARTTRVSRYQKGKTNVDFTEARDSEWQWHQLGRMQVCTLLQTDNHASNPTPQFFTGRMPFLPPNQRRQSTEFKDTVYDHTDKTQVCIDLYIIPWQWRVFFWVRLRTVADHRRLDIGQATCISPA